MPIFICREVIAQNEMTVLLTLAPHKAQFTGSSLFSAVWLLSNIFWLWVNDLSDVIKDDIGFKSHTVRPLLQRLSLFLFYDPSLVRPWTLRKYNTKSPDFSGTSLWSHPHILFCPARGPENQFGLLVPGTFELCCHCCPLWLASRYISERTVASMLTSQFIKCCTQMTLMEETTTVALKSS